MSGGERRRGCAILVNYSTGFQRWGRSSSDSAGVALARRGRMSFSQFPKARPLALHVAANEYSETLPSGFTAGKEAILSDDRNSPVEPFGRIVVDV